MENRIKKLLFDIFSSIENIEKFLGEKRVFAEYDKTRCCRMQLKETSKSLEKQ